jgi:hypothetical protein
MNKYGRYSYLNNKQISFFKNNLSFNLGHYPNSTSEVEGITYTTNNFGHRCDDFSKETASDNFLFAGCSFTFGVGVPYEHSWGYELNKQLNGNHFYNVSAAGRNAQVIVNEIYQYIRLFGKPKKVFVMFPNMDRDYFIKFYNNDHHGLHYKIETVGLLDPGGRYFETHDDFYTIFKYIKIETLFYDFYHAVSQLEDYLELLEIPFLWTTWCSQLSDSFKGEKIFKNYFELDFSYWEEKYRKENFYPPKSLGKNRKYWLDGADRPNPHPGILEHKFFASQFLKKLDEIENT